MLTQQNTSESATEQEPPRTPYKTAFPASSPSSAPSSSSSGSNGSSGSCEPPYAPKQLSHRNQRSKLRSISPSLVIAGRRLQYATSFQTRSSPYSIPSPVRKGFDVTSLPYGDELCGHTFATSLDYSSSFGSSTSTKNSVSFSSISSETFSSATSDSSHSSSASTSRHPQFSMSPNHPQLGISQLGPALFDKDDSVMRIEDYHRCRQNLKSSKRAELQTAASRCHRDWTHG